MTRFTHPAFTPSTTRGQWPPAGLGLEAEPSPTLSRNQQPRLRRPRVLYVVQIFPPWWSLCPAGPPLWVLLFLPRPHLGRCPMFSLRLWSVSQVSRELQASLLTAHRWSLPRPHCSVYEPVLN